MQANEQERLHAMASVENVSDDDTSSHIGDFSHTSLGEGWFFADDYWNSEDDQPPLAADVDAVLHPVEALYHDLRYPSVHVHGRHVSSAPRDTASAMSHAELWADHIHMKYHTWD